MSGSGAWLSAFTRTHGRAPRVLHVGNVANNAYLAAKMLNAAGVDSDVLCYGNYHFMASPEWEELDFGGAVDHDRPDWDAIAGHAFRRPDWFVQGPFGASVRYLEARRTGAMLRQRLWRIVADTRRRQVSSRRWRLLRQARQQLRSRPAAGASLPASSGADVAEYAGQRRWNLDAFRSLCVHYDLVHAYGAEPILPLAAGVRPFVAFEHGTLRQLPFQPTIEGRLVARAYQEADAVVITNADNNAAADRLGLARYRFIPHPVNDSRPDDRSVRALSAELKARLSADFLVLHPSRHHWTEGRNPHLEKANDRLIEGLALLIRDRPGAAAIFVDWGETVGASRALVAELGLADRVLWIQPQSGLSLARYMRACDVTADQFFLGAFGSTLPRAMGLAVPTILHLDLEAHRWCFPAPPPVINAGTKDTIAASLRRGYDDRSWLRSLGDESRAWYEAHHAPAVVQAALLDLYGDLLEQRAADAPRPS
jgi:glycosyltransferase involved in cell wall biosynthesis